MSAARHGHDGRGGKAGDTGSLSDLYALALRDMERPGNIGAGLKVAEMLMAHPGFRPRNGGKA